MTLVHRSILLDRRYRNQAAMCLSMVARAFRGRLRLTSVTIRHYQRTQTITTFLLDQTRGATVANIPQPELLRAIAQTSRIKRIGN